MNIDLGKNINTRDLETKIQKFWDENNFWDNDVNSDKKSFCVMMPPPNVTGNLHMGHALDNVLTDIICRYKRMSGFDFSFGYKGKGNVKDLRKHGRFNNIVIEEYKYYGKKISSTRIKANIIKGNFKLVERLLGYPYIISLKVIKSYKKDNNYLIEALPQDNTLIVPNNGIYNDFEIKDNIFYINSKTNIKTNKIIEFRYI